MAPVTPFIVEHMFQNLKRIAPKAQRVDSVHYLMMPQPIEVGQSCIISGDLNGNNRPSQIKHTQLCLLLMTRAYFSQAYQKVPMRFCHPIYQDSLRTALGLDN